MFDISTVRIFFLALFVLSFVLLGVLFRFQKRHSFYTYLLLFFSILLYLYGQLKLIDSTVPEQAILACQITYLGVSFFPVLSIFCIKQLTQTKGNSYIEIGFILLGLGIFLLSTTIGYSGIYYKRIDLIVTPGYSYIIKTYGPLHTFYPIYLFSAVFYSIGLIIASYKQRKKVSYLTSILLFSSMAFQVIVYSGARLLHLKIDVISIALILLEVIILILLMRMSHYDLNGLSRSAIENSKQFGFIIIDFDGRLCAVDSVTREWFPELDNVYIDFKIKDDSTDFLKMIKNHIQNPENSTVQYFERNGRILEAKFSIVEVHKGHKDYCLTIRDDTEQQQLSRLMKNYNEELTKQVSEKTAQLTKVQQDVIIGMASIVENRDANTGGHIKRTSDVVRIFVDYLMKENKFEQLTPAIAKCIIKAAPLHDFGKIGVPDVILNKPGKFEPEEYEIMKQHAAKGAVIVQEILQNSDDELFRKIAVNVAHYHHEKWAGNGYPCNLKGEEIPFEARIMALADVFDALVSKRVYKDSFSYDKAFSIIEESCGTHFEPELCKEFLKCRESLEALFNSYTN